MTTCDYSFQETSLTIVRGDDFQSEIILRKGDKQFEIPTSAAVSYEVLDTGGNVLISGTSLSTQIGADWLRSIIIVHIEDTITTTIPATHSRGKLKIRLDDLGDKSSVSLDVLIK